ncbi:MAG: hypothetical protein ABS37_14660 [Acidovorax sp. SCN 65-108]|nr:MAG: hypothetical protein ABS37_14660 [Acidovorax sp. SCN 65-108]OJV63707.1 MAG: hypothetical protein BGO35_17955 [Burkholderiales bacterium 64-34]
MLNKAKFTTRRAFPTAVILWGALLSGCASTAVVLTPSPQAPVCDPTATALVLWAPQWRLDQKDVVSREQAAEAGMNDFFRSSGCFARTELRRVTRLGPAAVAAELSASNDRIDRVVTIEIRELGPVVKLLSSAALVEGSTEVVFHVGVHSPQPGAGAREFAVNWRNGGPGVVKGVESLPADLSAALRSGLQSTTVPR